MPSAANGKSEKTPSSEATDNSPVRQILTIIEHKIRNLEKRKSKLTSYRDLQKAGKELNADQRVAVAKYDEVNQTLEFARDLSKQMASIAVSAEREAKKQAKREAWVRYAAETGKIREVLLILDCLMQMGNAEVREDFLKGANGAVKLTEADLKILDDLYPEVTPKHEVTEEGQPGFPAATTRAADHLYQIADGKPKEAFGTTYTHIKQIVSAVHECGYFDKGAVVEEAVVEEVIEVQEELPLEVVPIPASLPAAPAPAVVPQPAYPLRPLPPITLQEVEHAYFAQQYPAPAPRPISEVIGSQNFFFLQESEIDSPAPTPQPAPLPAHSPPMQIPTQTFTNQHFVLAGARVPPDQLPQPHFPPPHPELAAYPAPAPALPVPAPAPAPAPPAPTEEPAAAAQNGDAWAERGERAESGASPERRAHGQGDGQRYRRQNPRPNYRDRPRNSYQPRQGDYQQRKDGYSQQRQYADGYTPRHKEGYSRSGDYYGNGDSGNTHQGESNGRDRYGENGHYQGGYKSRGRGGARPPRGARQNYRNKPETAE